MEIYGEEEREREIYGDTVYVDGEGEKDRQIGGDIYGEGEREIDGDICIWRGGERERER